MRHLGYTRVSTTTQDLQLQLDALVSAGVEKRDVFADVTSGSKAAADRPGMKKLKPVKVTIDADATATQESEAVAQVMATAQSRWDAELKASTLAGAANKAQTVYGTCGWSSFSLSDASFAYTARVTARFQLNRSGWAYRTNEHAWDPRWTDF